MGPTSQSAMSSTSQGSTGAADQSAMGSTSQSAMGATSQMARARERAPTRVSELGRIYRSWVDQRNPEDWESDEEKSPFKARPAAKRDLGSGRSPDHPKLRRECQPSTIFRRIDKVTNITARQTSLTVDIVEDGVNYAIEHFTLWRIPNGPEAAYDWLKTLTPADQKKRMVSCPDFYNALIRHMKKMKRGPE